jgi:glycosyltransferase involved in cell wall biosynthesis
MLNLLYWEFLGLWAFRKYVSNHGKPDIIHVHSMIYGAAWAKAINSKYQVPYIITEHSTEFQLATISTKLIKYFAKVCTHSSGLFAVSTALSMKLSNIFSSSHLSWKVIPNLVSDVFFDDNLLTPNELISSPFVFINIGSLLKKKGQDILIRAFHLAFHEDRTTILKIAGTGPEKGNLLSLAKTLSISDQIEFLGEVSRVRVKEELKGSNCFVLSSTYETFGVVLIEALAQGLPVVSTACGGAQDIVREGKDGYLVPINDVESLAQALIKLKNQILLFDLKEISNSCKERFSSDAYVMNYQEAYKKALV